MFWDSTDWVRDEDGNVTREILRNHTGTKAFLQDGSDYIAYLIVADDFGCVMHEDEETKDNT
jgi:hypothetical protein